jgi:pyridoxal phosphate enzyme (YggS family)
MMRSVGENYRQLLDRIGEAALRSDRQPESVRLIGVTKRVSLERVQEAINCGLTDIGENRVQEAEQKIPLLASSNVTFHFIGHLQANKARKAVQLFNYIQSVDSPSLARRLDKLAAHPIEVMIQVKLEEEPSKDGILESALPGLIESVRASDHLTLMGLMTVPPFFEQAEAVRPYFRRLRASADSFGLTEVSMGMSRDFEIAIEEGATMVRIGTALFGTRD